MCYNPLMRPELSRARQHYLDLLKEAENAGCRYSRVGWYIAERLTPQDLRELLRDYAERQPDPTTTGDNTECQPPLF